MSEWGIQTVGSAPDRVVNVKAPPMARRARDAAKKRGGGGGRGGKKGRGGKTPWFVTPLTGKRYKRERNAAEREEFRPLARQLMKEEQASREQEATIGNYFDDYQRRIAAIQGRTADAYSAANQQASALMGQTAGFDTARQAAMQQAAADDAAKRGVDVDPSVGQRAVSAADARNRQQAAFGAALSGLGANQAAYLLDKERIGAGESIAARAKEAARRRSINADQRELAAKRADFRRDYRQRTRESEREFWLAGQELGAKKGYNRALVRQAQLGVKEKATPSVVINKGGGKDSGGYSVREAIALGRRQQAKKPSFPANRQSYIDYLVNRGVDIRVAKKAADRAGL